MRLLLTNDDGILSPVLTRVAEGLSRDHEVVVVAPATDQSGKSHSFTHGPHRLLHYQSVTAAGYSAYQVQGTPADCVKFALSHLFLSQPFDLVVSGINLGENAGISSIYSGTVAAAREAALWGTPGIAVSLWHTEENHLAQAIVWLRAFLECPDLLPNAGEYYNINFPPCSVENIRGARLATMSTAMFTDGYVAVTDEHGITGFRLEGHKPTEKFQPGSDDALMQQGYIAIVPMRIAQEAPQALTRLQACQNRFESLPRG